MCCVHALCRAALFTSKSCPPSQRMEEGNTFSSSILRWRTAFEAETHSAKTINIIIESLMVRESNPTSFSDRNHREKSFTCWDWRTSWTRPSCSWCPSAHPSESPESELCSPQDTHALFQWWSGNRTPHRSPTETTSTSLDINYLIMKHRSSFITMTMRCARPGQTPCTSVFAHATRRIGPIGMIYKQCGGVLTARHACKDLASTFFKNVLADWVLLNSPESEFCWTHRKVSSAEPASVNSPESEVTTRESAVL